MSLLVILLLPTAHVHWRHTVRLFWLTGGQDLLTRVQPSPILHPHGSSNGAALTTSPNLSDHGTASSVAVVSKKHLLMDPFTSSVIS
jgi:hypothetical protein